MKRASVEGPGPIPVVRLIVPEARGRVLILKRASTSYAQGEWCLPGGKVDYGDTAESAVTQELREETALECDQLRFLFYQDSLPTEPGGMHCVNLYFECVVSGDVALNSESSESRWIDPADLEQMRLVFRNGEGLRRYWGPVK